MPFSAAAKGEGAFAAATRRGDSGCPGAASSASDGALSPGPGGHTSIVSGLRAALRCSCTHRNRARACASTAEMPAAPGAERATAGVVTFEVEEEDADADDGELAAAAAAAAAVGVDSAAAAVVVDVSRRSASPSSATESSTSAMIWLVEGRSERKGNKRSRLRRRRRGRLGAKSNSIALFLSFSPFLLEFSYLHVVQRRAEHVCYRGERDHPCFW